MIKILRFPILFLLSIQCTHVFSQDASQEKVSPVPPAISSVTSVDSWKCTEYKRVDPKCRFRAIYIKPLKSEAIPRLEVEILEWLAYYDTKGPTMRMVAKGSIDVNSNDKTAAEAQKLTGERSIGCCSLLDINWEELKLKYSIQIGQKKFSCALNHLTEQNFGVDCTTSITN